MTGNINDPVWKKVPEITGFLALETAEPVKFQTRVKVTSDRKHLFAAFECDHPDPSCLRAEATRSSPYQLYKDDSVELFLDPSNKRLDYFHILVNGKGVWGAEHTERKWPCKGFKVKTSCGEEMWKAEIAIPLSELGVSVRKGTKWGVNFCRNTAVPKYASSSWAWTGIDFHRPGRFGTLVFR